MKHCQKKEIYSKGWTIQHAASYAEGSHSVEADEAAGSNLNPHDQGAEGNVPVIIYNPPLEKKNACIVSVLPVWQV